MRACARCASGCSPTASSRITAWSSSRIGARRMRWGVVTFPGSNDDAQALRVVERVLGDEAIARWRRGSLLTLPIKHGEGCYVADETTLAELEARDQVVFRYADAAGRVEPEANPNGSLGNIAGVCSAERNVLGLMPHPEYATERLVGGEDGLAVFRSVQSWLRDGGRSRGDEPRVQAP